MAPTPGSPAADEAVKVMVTALHVAARTNDLADVERYLRRQLRRGELNLTALHDHYGLRPPPQGLAALDWGAIPDHDRHQIEQFIHDTSWLDRAEKLLLFSPAV